jgi:Transcriptional regulator of a riboflavin/FAD biosynthetic operon
MVSIEDKYNMNFYEYSALKVICTLRKHNSLIKLSSSELGRKISVSQQTASRILINLEKYGFIERKSMGRSQGINLTESGLAFLYHEMAELYGILGVNEDTTISGVVSSGLGEGRYYVSKKPYVIEFTEKLGIVPYPGTLNLKISHEWEPTLRMLQSREGILIKGFESDDRSYGDVKAFKCSLNGTQCAAIFPYRSVYRDVLEIISSDFLREKFHLEDGDEVIIHFTSKN